MISLNPATQPQNQLVRSIVLSVKVKVNIVFLDKNSDDSMKLCVNISINPDIIQKLRRLEQYRF